VSHRKGSVRIGTLDGGMRLHSRAERRGSVRVELKKPRLVAKVLIARDGMAAGKSSHRVAK
jgi:hypothetical protein